jgi:hypothetical protein
MRQRLFEKWQAISEVFCLLFCRVKRKEKDARQWKELTNER